MTPKIGFAIIGTGSVATQHARAINSLEGCKLIAVCSSSEARAREAEVQFGVPGYYDVNTMFKEEDIQVVCICTESGQHLEPTLAAAAAGVHVLCEKPLEVSLERADQMITACREAGLKLGCIFQNRFSDDYVKAKQAVQEGALGELILGNAYIKWYRNPAYYASSFWRGTIEGDGGAALINQGIHTIDLLIDIMGDVERVYAKVKTVAHEIEGEDLGVAMLNFRNGALGVIEGATAAYPGYPERLEVFGTRGSIILEAGKIIAWNLMDSEEKAEPTASFDGSGASDPTAIGFELHRRQIGDMAEAIRNDRDPAVTGASGRKALALIKGIYASSKTGKELELGA